MEKIVIAILIITILLSVASILITFDSNKENTEKKLSEADNLQANIGFTITQTVKNIEKNESK